MEYSVQEAASMLNMNPHTIRFYTDKALIPNLKRDKNGYRKFDDGDINWLIIIYYLRECEMPLNAIRDYISLCQEGETSIDKRFKIITELRKKTKQQIREAETRLDFLNEKLEQFELIRKGKMRDDLNPLNWTNKKVQFISEQNNNKGIDG